MKSFLVLSSSGGKESPTKKCILMTKEVSKTPLPLYLDIKIGRAASVQFCNFSKTDSLSFTPTLAKCAEVRNNGGFEALICVSSRNYLCPFSYRMYKQVQCYEGEPLTRDFVKCVLLSLYLNNCHISPPCFSPRLWVWPFGTAINSFAFRCSLMTRHTN